jgi:hypothetical protein
MILSMILSVSQNLDAADAIDPGAKFVDQTITATTATPKKKKIRHLCDSNTRGQSPTAHKCLVAGDPVNHSGKVTLHDAVDFR